MSLVMAVQSVWDERMLSSQPVSLHVLIPITASVIACSHPNHSQCHRHVLISITVIIIGVMWACQAHSAVVAKSRVMNICLPSGLCGLETVLAHLRQPSIALDFPVATWHPSMWGGEHVQARASTVHVEW